METLRESELWREFQAWTRSFGGHQGGQEAKVMGMAEVREVEMLQSLGDQPLRKVPGGGLGK